MSIRIAIADDHFVVRQGVRQMIHLFPGMSVVAEASSGVELLDLLERQSVDLVLTDMTMPGLNGNELIAALRAKFPALPILVLSMHKESVVAFGALRSGANGYITKDSEPYDLAEAIRRVAAGRRYVMPELAEDMVFDTLTDRSDRLSVLSDREREVLEMIVAGKTIVQIANDIHVSPKTVSTHKMRLMQKLNIQSNADLILMASAELKRAAS